MKIIIIKAFIEKKERLPIKENIRMIKLFFPMTRADKVTMETYSKYQGKITDQNSTSSQTIIQVRQKKDTSRLKRTKKILTINELFLKEVLKNILQPGKERRDARNRVSK